MRSDLLLSLVVTAAGVAALVLLPGQIAGFGYDAIGDMRSPVVFPAVSATVLAVLGAVLGITTAVRAVPAPRGEEETRPAGPRTALVFAIVVAYVAAVPWIGLVPASLGAFVAMALAFGYRRPVPVALLAVATVLLVQVLFADLLHIVFPDPRVALW